MTERQTVRFQGIDFEVPPGMTPGQEPEHTLDQLGAGASRWVEFRQAPPAVEATLSNGGRYYLTAGCLLFNEHGSFLGMLYPAASPRERSG